MTNQTTTRTCPDCRTIFRHRGQDRCPHCGHRFGVVQTASSAESRAVRQRPAVAEAPPPPPPAEPPPPPPSRPEPVQEFTSELDALLLPYSPNPVNRAEPAVQEPVASTIPPFELPSEPQVVQHEEQPRVPIPGGTQHVVPMDPVDEALAGEHLVPAASRQKVRQSQRMPWYLRRETLIGLALVALVLVAVIFQLAG